MNANMTDRESMMFKVQVYGFALSEVALFLDTHPNDKTALSYYKQYRDQKNQAEDDFRKKFGPLTMDDNYDYSTWTWIDSPWPWEKESEV